MKYKQLASNRSVGFISHEGYTKHRRVADFQLFRSSHDERDLHGAENQYSNLNINSHANVWTISFFLGNPCLHPSNLVRSTAARAIVELAVGRYNEFENISFFSLFVMYWLGIISFFDI
jgi:hypothetical protein